MKTTTCRECEGKISLEGLCNEHERQLEQIVDKYPTLESLFESIDDHLIAELLDSNDAWDLVENVHYYSFYPNPKERDEERFKAIKNGMINWAKDNDNKESSLSLNSLKGDFIDAGHVDDDFRRFFFNELFYNEDLWSDYLY